MPYIPAHLDYMLVRGRCSVTVLAVSTIGSCWGKPWRKQALEVLPIGWQAGSVCSCTCKNLL